MRKTRPTILLLVSTFTLVLSCTTGTPAPGPTAERPNDTTGHHASNKAFKERELRDSLDLARTRPDLMARVLKGDTLLAQGDTLAAVNIWRKLATDHRGTFIYRQVAHRILPTPIMRYIMDHSMELQ